MAGVVQLQQAGDAIIVAIAGFLKKQGWSYFVGHWKAFYDGLMGGQEIPAEWFDLDDNEKAGLALHWTATMADHGIASVHAEFLIGKIMGILKDAWDIYAHFNEGAGEAMAVAENAATKAGEPGASRG